MPLGVEVGLGPGDTVLDGDPAPSTERSATTSQFSAHVYCGQTVARLSNCVKIRAGVLAVGWMKNLQKVVESTLVPTGREIAHAQKRNP